VALIKRDSGLIDHEFMHFMDKGKSPEQEEESHRRELENQRREEAKHRKAVDHALQMGDDPRWKTHETCSVA
jgi:hypothetical protein